MAARPLAFVVQRYGEEIVGGSESLCRIMAEMIATDRPVEILTSCAMDYITWKDEYPAGVSTLNGVTVRRFSVDFERDHRFHDEFNAVLGGMLLTDYPHHKAQMRAIIARSPREQQLSSMKLQGPYATPLFQHLAQHHQAYGLVVFFTYLYPPTVFGAPLVPAAKTVLVPAAHDEAQIHFPIFRDLFARFPAFIFLTPEERTFVEETFAVDRALKATIGMPVALAGQPDGARFRTKYGIDSPFLLYAGRLDSSKGTPELLRAFQAAKPSLPDDLQLVLFGNRAIDLPRDPRIRYLGRLSEQDKLDAMAAATLFVNPSPFESFSIVILEAMLCGTPLLVNGHCEVLKGHVLRAKSGLYYNDLPEFVEGVRLLLGDEALRLRMGANGAAYVRQNYSNEIVQRRYREAFAAIEKRAAHATPTSV